MNFKWNLECKEHHNLLFRRIIPVSRKKLNFHLNVCCFFSPAGRTLFSFFPSDVLLSGADFLRAGRRLLQTDAQKPSHFNRLFFRTLVFVWHQNPPSSVQSTAVTTSGLLLGLFPAVQLQQEVTVCFF